MKASNHKGQGLDQFHKDTRGYPYYTFDIIFTIAILSKLSRRQPGGLILNVMKDD
jgi:hypothetical protein